MNELAKSINGQSIRLFRHPTNKRNNLPGSTEKISRTHSWEGVLSKRSSLGWAECVLY